VIPKDQPIATATIARIYMRQGMLDEAEALFKRLLRVQGDDPALREGLAEIARLRAADTRTNQDQDHDQEDRVVLEPRRDSVLCRWNASPEGQRRAEGVLGHEGRLSLRLVAYPREQGRSPHDVTVDGAHGDLSFKPPREALLMAAALGVMGNDEQFVSITHCEPVTLGGPDAADPREAA